MLATVLDTWASFLAFLVLLLGTQLFQCVAFCKAANSAMRSSKLDKAFQFVAYSLYVDSVMTLLLPAASCWAYESLGSAAQVSACTINVCLQPWSALLLGSMIGPRGWDDPLAA